jgi:hypothetical protein
LAILHQKRALLSVVVGLFFWGHSILFFILEDVAGSFKSTAFILHNRYQTKTSALICQKNLFWCSWSIIVHHLAKWNVGGVVHHGLPFVWGCGASPPALPGVTY